MPEQLALIMDEIRNGTLQPIVPPPKWQRLSYFAAVLDVPGMELTEDDAVTFNWKGLSRGNHSFRDGMDVRPLRAPHSALVGFFCLNHMQHKLGHVLRRNEWEDFDVHFNHPHAIAPEVRILGHNDSGTNLGPPTPPP